MTITLRTQTAAGATTKSDTLTHAELDNNFIDLLQNKLTDIVDDTTPTLGGSLDANSNNLTNVGTLNGHTIPGGTGTIALTSDISAASGIQHLTAGTGIQLTSEDSAGEVTITNDGMINLSDDSNPELGGNLNMQNFKIISTSAQDIKIEPDAAGDIYLESDTVFAGELNQQAHLTSQGTGNLLLSTNNDTSSGKIKINQGASGNIEIQPDGGGRIRFHNAYNMPSSDGSNGQAITTDGTGNLSFTTVSGGGGVEIQAGTGITVTQDDSAGAYTISATSSFSPASPGELGASTPDIGNFTDLKVKAASSVVKELQLHDQDNSNYVGFKAPTTVSTNKVYVLPSTDGTNGQFLTTDGGANLSWTTAAGGGGDSVGAGDNISITNADSAGEKTISFSPNQPINFSDQQLSNLSIKNYGEIVYTGGTTTGTITPDPNDGSVQKITLSGSITLNSLSSVASGDSMTLIVKQPGSGGPYTLSSTMKFAGGTKTLSTAANAIDIITIFYDGTDYFASLSTNFS